MRDFIALRWQRKLRNRRRIAPRTARFGHEKPHVSVAFLAWIVRSMNFFRLYHGVSGQRRDLSACPRVHIELPSVITTFEVLSVNSTAGERNTAMGADVLHRKSAPVNVASKH